ncbi:oxidoreductase [Nostoc linckia z18]|uniref:Oxidoreductase n=2 Tax=Nostoc linckia TaxID=92942 RepID=A0A9Q5Z9S2_NOSLI|nr:NAD(P)-dependent oxidoreductase [Nostoc linckia]PHK40321.1 oxidoreductase [Nostoc linckia z15]PHK44227.1 oxidoreductase [Nostoc linckia z16]PHJ58167.1 oxidoreductase [Nostoc linckia z1]PHJ59174.1 oxidoreductase [Nostoc linckia z3]PHJ63465.1 oxidoreductase [Nostoc linckia z2]
MNFKNQTLLITGINEFVGLRAAELAIAQGIKVRGLQTSKEQNKTALNLGIEVITGNIADPNIAQKACQGIDVVLHTEQMAQEAGPINHFREINVNGAVNIAKAAKQAGISTFVHLSSVMVYGFNYLDGVTETDTLSNDNNPYCQTKIEAETALLELNNPPDFGIIIIRAGDIYGPGSIPWIVKPILMMRQKLFAYPNDGKGVINHVYIDNLIDGIFLAIEKQTYGEIFNITDGQQTSWKEYFMRLAAMENLPAPLSLPKDEMKLFLKLRAQGQKLFRKKADILPESVDFMTRPYACSIAKAQTLLDYKPIIDLEEGMQRTHEWLQQTEIENLVK